MDLGHIHREIVGGGQTEGGKVAKLVDDGFQIIIGALRLVEQESRVVRGQIYGEAHVQLGVAGLDVAQVALPHVAEQFAQFAGHLVHTGLNRVQLGLLVRVGIPVQAGLVQIIVAVGEIGGLHRDDIVLHQPVQGLSVRHGVVPAVGLGICVFGEGVVAAGGGHLIAQGDHLQQGGPCGLILGLSQPAVDGQVGGGVQPVGLILQAGESPRLPLIEIGVVAVQGRPVIGDLLVVLLAEGDLTVGGDRRAAIGVGQFLAHGLGQLSTVVGGQQGLNGHETGAVDL